MRFQFPGWRGRFMLMAATLTALTACASAPVAPAANAPVSNVPVASASTTDTPAPAATIALNEGRYTPLGRVRVSDNPTASDFADLQAAESGKLGLPAFVEFYADN